MAHTIKFAFPRLSLALGIVLNSATYLVGSTVISRSWRRRTKGLPLTLYCALKLSTPLLLHLRVKIKSVMAYLFVSAGNDLVRILGVPELKEPRGFKPRPIPVDGCTGDLDPTVHCQGRVAPEET